MSNEEQALPPANRKLGLTLLVAAAVLWSTGGFFAKAPQFEDWPGPLLAFWRAVFASVLLLPLVRQPKWSWRLVPMTISFALMNLTFLTAMKATEASNAIWLQNTAPIWVFLVSVFLFREPLHRRDLAMVAFGSAGVAFILFFELSNASAKGVIYGLLSAVTYAGVVLSLRMLRDQQASWLVALNHVVAAIALSPYLIAGGEQYWPRGGQWPLLVAFGVLQMGGPYVLFARGLKSVPSHEASGVVLLEPLLTPVWVFLAWRHHPSYESPRWWTMVGAALILSGLLIRYQPFRGWGRRRFETEDSAPKDAGEN